MLRQILEKIVGDPDARELRRLQPLVVRVNALETEYQNLSDEELRSKTAEFRHRLVSGETPDDLMVEAFAVVKNACRRLSGTSWEVRGNPVTWEMIPYDTQLLGGMVLHGGKIAEMKTGEGKTLVCTLPLYLNALSSRGAHLITANSYLATRDAEWMGGLFRYLGLTIGVIQHGMTTAERQAAYACDITYGTNTEMGFDYLRDNMARDASECVQRELHYAIVDEVDSILIDEARTPLIVSAPAAEGTEKYAQYTKLIGLLTASTHYEIDEKAKTATLTEAGIQKMEELLGVENIYTERGFAEVHHIEQALKAQAVFRRDKDYVVQGDEIVIVDEFTGRLMPGRRYSDGLHQALEAKEGVEVKRESKTLATITIQNYFRMYTRLAGMTGTAKTEAEEFSKIYGLQVITIPTNRPVARRDLPDSVYKTETGKLKAIAERIKSVHETGQPILVGTVTIEKSELIGQMLLRSGVPAKILNAKHHEREAEIIARAGERGAVTIATNMAGRGTDIKLATGVAELGGLYVLGTERHESRRIDNQLRGRSGRQGDPGTSQFFVSMEDSLMRLFGGDKMKRIMEFLRVPDDMPIENKSISNNIESAQKKVEAHNFDIRKHVVQYDDVMNRHREIIYGRRRQILEHTEIKSAILSLLGEEAAELVRATAITPDAADWDYEQLLQSVQHLCPALGTLTLSELQTHTKSAALKNFLTEKLEAAYLAKEATLENPAALRHTERQIYLATLDRLWMEHLENMRYLREKVALRGYGQRDPLLEYKGEAYQLFDTLMQNIRTNTIQTLFRTEIGIAPSVTTPTRTQIITNDAEITDILTGDRELVGAPTIPKTDPTSSLQFASLSELPKANPEVATLGSTGPTVIKLNSEQKNQGNLETGRNELCPCGSKKKFKKCCG